MKKTIIRVLAGMLLLAVIYFVATDAMMTIFGLPRKIQYAFNMGAILILLPFGVYYFVGGGDTK